jgi:hypothetical protein
VARESGERGARRAAGFAAAALLGAACASSSGLVYATGAGSVTGDGLHRVRWSQLGAEFVKPGAELGRYQQVLLDPLTISMASDGQPRRMGPTKQYAPTPGYLQGMTRTYRETFAKSFQHGGFRLVSEPGPGVLRISGHVVDLVLTAQLDPEQDTDTVELVSSFGELTMLIDVRDAASGEPLLRTVDRQPISRTPLTGATRNTTGGNLSAQRELFGHQALLLRDEIVKFQRMGQVPEPPAEAAASPAAPSPQR